MSLKLVLNAGLTQEIETLTSLAISETEDSLHIDKNFLKQQEQAIEKLDDFMAVHQENFDALGEQGTRLGESADSFTAAMKLQLEGLDYDNIRISSPEEGGVKAFVEASMQCHSHDFSI